jgi:membrane-associated phospholipid phosphatase
MMTLVLMYLSVRYRIRLRWWVVITGSLLVVATVYQRYHYAIDLIGGALFMVLCVVTAPRLYAAVKKRLHTMETRFPDS